MKLGISSLNLDLKTAPKIDWATTNIDSLSYIPPWESITITEELFLQLDGSILDVELNEKGIYVIEKPKRVEG